MTLLQEIQDAATGQEVPLAVLLRKCAVLAQRLKNEPLAEWATLELNGYPDSSDSLPPYRRFRAAEVVGDFAGPFGSGLKNARIPEHVVSDEDRSFLFNFALAQPVAELQRLAESDSTTVHAPWPAVYLSIYGDKIYENMVAMTATRVLPTAAVAGALDAIRNKVLAFALEIEGETGDAGTSDAEVASIPDERVTQIFNTTVYGGQANLAGGAEVAQTAGQDSGEASSSRFWAVRHPWLTGLILGVPGLALAILGIWLAG